MAAMVHAWFDVSAGVAGDMLLGSLLDAGADAAAVQAAVEAVVPGSVRLDTEVVTRAGQRATKARVRVLADDPPHRTWRTIQAMLADAELADATRAWAQASFRRLAEAEGATHGIDPDEVHFHEVGALDSIADVVGTCEALRLLGVTSVSASPVALGSGRVRAAHGDIPVPVPAVARLAVGWRTVTPTASDHGHSHPHPHHHDRDHQHEHGHDDEHSHTHPHGHSHGHDDLPHDHDGPHARSHESPPERGRSHEQDHVHGHSHDQAHDRPATILTPGELGELATPTGLAVIRALASACEALPPMLVTGVGVGAGGRDTPGRPNVVRVILGETQASADADVPPTSLVELMANVDDLDPRLWPGVLTACLDAGAADAWLVPIQMKKGRPAFTLHALAAPAVRDAVADAILTHTSSLGVRQVAVERTVLDRHWLDVDVLGHVVPVKVGSRSGTVVNAAVEFDAAAALASELGVPTADVVQRATAAAVTAGLSAGAELPPQARPSRSRLAR